MDDGDRASEQEVANIRQALANFDHYRSRFVESLTKCVQCGAQIPEGRRKAVPGCQMCVTCQEIEDSRGGFWE